LKKNYVNIINYYCDIPLSID